MAKDNEGFSPRTQGLLADINRLVGRIGSYKESIVALKPGASEEKLLHFYGSLSVIEGLGAKAIRENAPSHVVDKLVEVIHNSRIEHLKLAVTPEERQKIELNSAKTEAAVKGFVLPLALGGPSDELESFGLEKNEMLVPMKATGQAILELANKHIPKEEYAQAIIKRTEEILKSDPRGFSSEKLEQYSKFVGQGKQSVKQSERLTATEKGPVESAVVQNITGLVNSLEKDAQGVSPILLVSNVIKQMEKEQNVKFTPERVEKITRALAPTLAKLGPEYLEVHKKELTQELVTSLKSEQSYSTSFTGSYTVSTSSLGKIAAKLEKQHQPQAEKASVKEVEGAIFKKKMKTIDIADKLNAFAEKTGMAKIGGEKLYNAQSIPTTAAIAKMRQSNPKQFDKIFNAPIPLPRPSPILVKEALALANDRNLSHPAPGKEGEQPPKKTPPPIPSRPRSGGVRPRSDGVGGRS